jgi:hypothetical protein
MVLHLFITRCGCFSLSTGAHLASAGKKKRSFGLSKPNRYWCTPKTFVFGSVCLAEAQTGDKPSNIPKKVQT